MNALVTHNLGKKYDIYHRPLNRLLEWATFGRKRLHEDFWALRGVNLEVKKGQTLGIVGTNGAGKSTLLKLLTGTSFPSEGTIELNGRVTGLLELGAGFHPEFTGRDNVTMSCSLMGMSRAETASRIDEIRDFAEIGDFFEQPVKTYSSGMYMRLGFSVAACLDPDILVVDEALSVGDEYFVQKCIERFNEFKRQGKTILLVTHLLRNVRLLCDRAFLIERGRFVAEGDPDEVANAYTAILAEHARTGAMQAKRPESGGGAPDGGSDVVQMFDVKTVDADGQTRESFKTGQPMEFRASYEIKSDVKNPLFVLYIHKEDGTLLIENCVEIERLYTQNWGKLKDIMPSYPPKSKGQRGQITCRFESLPLTGGTYYFNFRFIDTSEYTPNALYQTHMIYFTVEKERAGLDGQYYVIGKWADKPLE